MDSPTPKRVSKACDACKLRKVKCNGQERCQQCTHLGLRCIYSVSSAKRSQGKRGRIISEYKSKTATQSNMTSPPILAASPGQAPLSSPFQDVAHYPGSGSRRGTDHPLRYSHAFFLDLIPDYMEVVYPVQPVIPEQELRGYIHVMESDQELLSFVHAFGACTLNLTRFGNRRTEEVNETIKTLINYSIETMRPAYANFPYSVLRAMQSMFIHNCLMTMQASDAAFYYIRDAITVIQLLRIDNHDSMVLLSPPERARRQRLYWQAFIHERFVAILDYRSAVLPPLESLPEDDPTIPIAVREGFNQIIKLFRLLDHDFLHNWIGTHGNITPTWIEAKSRELDGSTDPSAQNLTHLSTMQKADLAITREWLRTLIWRLAMSQALLSSRSSKECLTLLFPVRLSQSLRHLVTTLSRPAIEVHGTSIVQKLFEITDTIADVLIHVPAPSLEETALRIDDYLFLLAFVLHFPTLDHTRRAILIEKLQRLQAMFPEVCSNSSATSSPTGPLDVQSPPAPTTTDPWFFVAQSKLGTETTGLGLGLDMPGALDSAIPFPDAGSSPSLPPESEGTHKAAWNQISRRLSMVTFPQE